MKDINQVHISGRLTRDPIIGSNGKTSARIVVASNEHFRDGTGALQERTAFVFCKIFGGLAQIVQNRKKGDVVMVTGRLRTDRGVDNRQPQLVLICDSVQFPVSALDPGSNP
jgi:single stranded DNA-binding protein